MIASFFAVAATMNRLFLNVGSVVAIDFGVVVAAIVVVAPLNNVVLC